jgi:hypothetical protein
MSKIGSRRDRTRREATVRPGEVHPGEYVSGFDVVCCSEVRGKIRWYTSPEMIELDPGWWMTPNDDGTLPEAGDVPPGYPPKLRFECLRCGKNALRRQEWVDAQRADLNLPPYTARVVSLQLDRLLA